MDEQCTCGGTLRPAIVLLDRKISGARYLFGVDGLKCDRCRDEVIPREIAIQLRDSLGGYRVRRGPDEFVYTGMTPMVEYQDAYKDAAAGQFVLDPVAA